MTPQYGEGFAGRGAESAHVNTVLGRRDGPVGVAWATALASPSVGHTPFVVVIEPGLPVAPFTLFVNKAAIASEVHGHLTWGAAQAGVAAGVGSRLGRILDATGADPVELAIIAAVWVDPAARDEDAVFANNLDATVAAVEMGLNGRPRMEEISSRLAAGDPTNPYFRRAT